MENLTFTYTCVPGPGTWYYSTVIYLYIYSTHTVDLFSKPFLIVGEVPQVFCVRIYRNLKYYTMRTSRMGTSLIPVKSLSSRHVVRRSRRSSSLPTSLFPGSSLQPLARPHGHDPRLRRASFRDGCAAWPRAPWSTVTTGSGSTFWYVPQVLASASLQDAP